MLYSVNFGIKNNQNTTNIYFKIILLVTKFCEYFYLLVFVTEILLNGSFNFYKLNLHISTHPFLNCGFNVQYKLIYTVEQYSL